MSEVHKNYRLFNCRAIYFILLINCTVLSGRVTAQTSYSDSLQNLLHYLPDDTAKVIVYERLTGYYSTSWPDSSIHFAKEGLKLANRLNLPLRQITLNQSMSIALGERGNFSLSLEHAFKALEIAKLSGDKFNVTKSNSFIAVAYFYAEDYANAIMYVKEVQRDQESVARDRSLYAGFLGEVYYHLEEFDSALFYTKLSYDLIRASKGHWAVPFLYMGKLAEHKGQLIEALAYYKASISKPVSQADYVKAYLAISDVFKQLKKSDSSIYHAKLAYRISKSTALYRYSYQASELLKLLYKQNGQVDSAFKYQELMLVEKDSLFSREKLNRIQSIAYENEKYLDTLRIERERFVNRIKLYSLIAGLILILLTVLIQIRNSRFKQRAYNLLQKQKSDIDEQKSKIEKTLSELKATQSQLIQSEKMASLGELTAGIAHEIQNPLNFVNNFSEVNTELIDEMQQEMDKGNLADAKAISNDIKENEQKINHHGKRAGEIVKGMLQHSRSSSGVKEPTDINALADEYLRLAYHGLRAKDKSFNATMKTDFDETIGNLNIIPQDIGRVILNLITNAFYAVNEKHEAESSKLKAGGEYYEPTVSISTKKEGNKVFISVKDNGNGIPQKILDKIFQPFFTTKPTGQGTGLGLSLSYDIVKAHGGELSVRTPLEKVESKEREGSEFIIQLPIV